LLVIGGRPLEERRSTAAYCSTVWARVTNALKPGVGALPGAYAECVSDEADGFEARLGCHGPGARSGIRLVKLQVWAWRPGWLIAAAFSAGPRTGFSGRSISTAAGGGAEMTNQSAPDDERQRGTLGRAGEDI
jgi:hypothetical protein